MKIRRGPIRDSYVEDGVAAVMVDEEVLVLSEVATSILRAVPPTGSIELTDLVGLVIEGHGLPEHPLSPEALTREQVFDLAAHRILAIETSEAPGHDLADTTTRGPALQALTGAMRATLAPDASSPWVFPSSLPERDFMAAAERQRVVAQLMVDPERLSLRGSLTAALRARQGHLRAASENAASDLSRALDALEHAGVPCLVFKGMALAAQAWGDPWGRGYGDLDLLVHPAKLAVAHKALTEAGWASGLTYPSPGPSWGWRHFVRTDYEMTLTNGRTAIDLHWHALPARGAFPDFDRVWTRRASVVLGGRTVQTFCSYDALAHSASHSAKDGWRWLRGLADVHRLMSQLHTWELADRPLRPDQLITVGIAARIFGLPANAPSVVGDAMLRSERFLPSALRAQLAPERAAPEDWTPGVGLAQMMRALWHARVPPNEFARRASTSALPPWALAQEMSPHAYVAAPRALRHRGAELLRKLRDGRASSR